MARLFDNNTGKFTKCTSTATRELILGKDQLGLYLQAKIAQMTGKKADEVLLGTPIRIPQNYANNEGVINSMQKESGFEKGLRIDLQKPQMIKNLFRFSSSPTNALLPSGIC